MLSPMRCGSYFFASSSASAARCFANLAADLPDEMVEETARAHCDWFGGKDWYDIGQHVESKHELLNAARAALTAALTGEAG